MHIKQRKNKKWKTLFLKTASGFLCLFLTFCLRSEGSSFSVSVKVRGQRRWRPKVTGWVKCREQRDEDEEEGGLRRAMNLRRSVWDTERGGGKSMLVKTWRQTQKQQTSDNMTLTTGSQIQKKNNLFGSLGRMYIFFLFKKSRQKPTTSRIYMKLSSASKWTNRLRLRVVKGINLWGVECQ